MWECGLKRTVDGTHEKIKRSLLMWECGLKPLHIVYLREQPLVTPYVGVWIETGVAGLISDTT